MTKVLRTGYGLWCWAIFLPIGMAALLLALPAPGIQLRRRIARRGARAFFALAGIRLDVRGLEHLPDGACVVVANHASYLDGVIMHAALPPRFAFVIKKEMVRVPLASIFLRRLGSEFVDRVDPHQGASDARRVVRTATSGQALAVFPEGTFTEVPGIGKFLPGAFVAAARAGLPVVPAAIRGARNILPLYKNLPRHGHIEVEIFAALEATTSRDRKVINQLRDDARRAIVAAVGEPDLEA